ncbi:MAG: ribosome small subunit-dependent GTPase A [Gammaproteobacteria bacterium]|nr:ribosome small subunit-dependent GTPase A [Gammaproteobacteria bacterium]MDH4254722.1 ribosome small subunit-dependent GTPase A [Gammaproteobacteria bacterium]MDH5308700.1 ribosome small subunit-dependent GTPase A [Gammaproteobacteria bacterium]
MSPKSGQDAQVIATFSRRMNLRLDDGREVSARIKGKRLQPVCGDRVVAEPIENESDWLITDIHPRRAELTRPDSRGNREVLAANVSLLVVTVADPPRPDWFVVDRYLAAAAIMGVRAVIVFNKADLEPTQPGATAVLDDYARSGYTVLCTSAKTGSGLDELCDVLKDEVGIVVGQSGVGKSTLINRLVDEGVLRTAVVSPSSGEGRHTTVNSVMLDLPGGGTVIDSPGVRDYAPALESPDQVAAGFREIANAGLRCRFANCRHLREPGCAVKGAVESGLISARRYESYKRLLHLTEKLGKNRY